MTIRSLGYLKLLIESMLVTVDSPKHKVLCCSGRGWTQCCSPSNILPGENILGLAYSKSELQSVEALNLESDLQLTQNYKKLRSYQPVSINPKWKHASIRQAVTNLQRQVNQVKGGAVEREDQPMMFLPGRVLHLEETEQYGRSK